LKKTLLFAAIVSVGIYAQDNTGNDCNYNPEYRQSLVDNYNEAVQRYDDLKGQQTECYERCKFDNRNNTSLYSSNHCSNGMLITQAGRIKEERKSKIEEYDEKTNGCREH
jgi:hypothetical protein